MFEYKIISFTKQEILDYEAKYSLNNYGEVGWEAFNTELIEPYVVVFLKRKLNKK